MYGPCSVDPDAACANNVRARVLDDRASFALDVGFGLAKFFQF